MTHCHNYIKRPVEIKTIKMNGSEHRFQFRIDLGLEFFFPRWRQIDRGISRNLQLFGEKLEEMPIVEIHLVPAFRSKFARVQLLLQIFDPDAADHALRG